MKLQKQLSRKVGQQEYSKFVLTISPKDIDKLGWKQGQEIELIVNGKEAKLKPKK
jgi:hypothetical protein